MKTCRTSGAAQAGESKHTPRKQAARAGGAKRGRPERGGQRTAAGSFVVCAFSCFGSLPGGVSVSDGGAAPTAAGRVLLCVSWRDGGFQIV